VLRRISGSGRDEMTGDWRKLRNEKLYNLYSSQNIWVIKSRMLTLAGNVQRTGAMRNASKILVGKLEGMCYPEDLGVDGRILKWVWGVDWHFCRRRGL
jgi:hypothetical protein